MVYCVDDIKTIHKVCLYKTYKFTIEQCTESKTTAYPMIKSSHKYLMWYVKTYRWFKVDL